MSTKLIESVFSPAPPHFVGDGFRVHNFIPGQGRLSMQRMDPFIMFDYGSKYYFAPRNEPRGVGVHPHRGFETVTIAYKGSVAHNDSSGGGGIIDEGDVQWMTAASGVLHKEYHAEKFSKKGGAFQMVQLWVNLPAKYKMSAPKYQALKNESIHRYLLPENTGEIEVIAGQYKDVIGSASTFSPLHLLNVKLKANATAEFTFPANFNTALLIVEGTVVVNTATVVPVNHFALFKNEGEDFTMTASEDAIVLVLSGEPLNEPIAAHGPFVMNSKAELIQAFEDFNNGKFGYLED